MNDSSTGTRNTAYRWIVDREGLVHARICSQASPQAIGYGSSPKNPLEMMAHLGRPDFKDGHFAPGILRACSNCIVEDE